jgi:hypothetical protein
MIEGTDKAGGAKRRRGRPTSSGDGSPNRSRNVGAMKVTGSYGTTFTKVDERRRRGPKYGIMTVEKTSTFELAPEKAYRPG